VSEQDIMQDDLRELLDALGMFSGAQPQSPHEVMQNAIAAVRRLRKVERAARTVELAFRANMPKAQPKALRLLYRVLKEDK
jgi:hypothetical protein